MPNEYHYEVITYLSDSLLADLLRALFDMFVPLEFYSLRLRMSQNLLYHSHLFLVSNYTAAVIYVTM